MPSPKPRRAILRRAALASVLVPLAGCSTELYSSEDGTGQPDIVLKNCHSEPKTVQVTVTHVETGETVYDETHTVPEDYCSDVGPSYELETVWTDPGEYVIRAEAEEMEPAEATVLLSEHAVTNDTATREIHIDDGEIRIPGEDS